MHLALIFNTNVNSVLLYGSEKQTETSTSIKEHHWDKTTAYHQKRRLAEKGQTTTSGRNHWNAQMEVERAYCKESKHEHHNTSLTAEPTNTTKAKDQRIS